MNAGSSPGTPSRPSASRPLHVAALSVLLAGFGWTGSAFAIENESSDSTTLPGAPRLLPSDTLAYVRLDDADDLREDLRNSSMGRMLNDPKMRPFADEFYVTARELFDRISDEVGVSLDELLAIPHGQVAIAVHPAKPLDEDDKPELDFDDEDDDTRQRRMETLRRREAYSFGGTLIIDAGEHIDSLMSIVDRLQQRATEGPFRLRTKKVDGTEVTRLLPSRPGRMPIEFFEKENTLVIGVGHRSAQDVLDHWNGESDEPTLAENATFGTMISRCVGAEETRPQLTFFVDPHSIIDRVVKRSGSLTAGLFWPVFQELGASRIGGIAGSSFRGGDVFEGIAHYHINIQPPRDGVLGVLRPETGDTSPPNWVPASVSGYTSIHWDIAQTYTNLSKIFERFQGQEALKNAVETPLKTRLGVELQEDVIDNLTGRVIRAAWMEMPIRFNSGVNVFAFELSDTIKAKSVIAKVRDRMPNALTVETVGGHVVYRLRGPGPNFPENMRRPEPSLVILGDWLVYADSTKFIEKASLAAGGNLPRLVDLPEYGLVSGELGGQLKGESPFLLSFLKGSDSIRVIYDLAKDENSRNALRHAGEGNVVARKFSELLDRNELPPFSEFEKYFAPTGVFGYDEPDGIHFGFYTLRADPIEDEDKE
ncbi:hypothetical protein FYK55_22685 [Roseiconus nitratireducens]|uniref:Uncharacterized protein n=1 Tax=Roseiconus nitratireducens TaxID=2605748 RepID=A0A5M6CZL8_9BACT|nr:hypothetical protein [Roseiconus nitratireducens]KAA5539860.1 hypothetical protein FYK55_22685 [Roseiconus nitratireducens]